MKDHRLPLPDFEESLVARIDLRLSHRNHEEEHAAFLANQLPILELLKSLTERGAVPPQRLSYWNDPDFKPGRIKGSRKQLFERNGCEGGDLHASPLHQAPTVHSARRRSPEPVMQAFETGVGDPRWVSYGDVLDLGKSARQLVRRHGLVPSEACEEFFKLTLDLELGVDSPTRRLPSPIHPR